MKKYLSLMLVFILVLSLMLTGCSDSGNKAAKEGEKVYKVACSTSVSKDDPMGKSYLAFEKLVEERSDGRIDVEVYLNGELAASNREQLEMVMENTLQWNTVPAMELFTQSPELSEFLLFDLPYMFDSYEAFNKFVDSDFVKEELFPQATDALGIYVYPAHALGFVEVGSTKGPITEASSLRNQKIRTSLSEVYIDMVKSWGAAPTSVEWHECYTALQQGALDGMTTGQNLFITTKLNETMEYYADINAMPFNHFVVVNKNFMDSLPDDLKAIFEECIIENIDQSRAFQKEACDAAWEFLKENNTVTELTDGQRATFSKSAKDIWKSKEKLIGADFLKSALAEIGKTLE